MGLVDTENGVLLKATLKALAVLFVIGLVECLPKLFKRRSLQNVDLGAF